MMLEQARKYALALPGATEAPHFEYTSFRVRGKIFATARPDGSSMHIFVDEELRAPLIATEPEIYEALHWGSKVVGVKVALLHAKAGTVNRLLLESWKRKASKHLAAVFAHGKH
ncbi:MAG: MmcQ/YjbR family DNA-binding protein [Pseudomonadota bacterium]